MKKTYFTLACFLITFIAQAQIVNIPDANFKALLTGYSNHSIDTNLDNEIQVSEALAVTTLDLIAYSWSGSITNLTGLEAFSNLTSLKMKWFNNVTSIDFSNFTQLQTLDCSSNDILTTLNVSGLTQLQSLKCDGNYYLTALNLTGLTQLKSLICVGARFMTSIDLSSLTQLEYLDCSSCNNLSDLNLAGLTNLQYLDCSLCYQVTSLDFTSIPNLKEFRCNGCNFTSLDVSPLLQLENLYCPGLYLMTNLNVSNLQHLKKLNCTNSPLLTTLDVSGLSALETLECSISGLTNLVLTGANAVKQLNCSRNHLSAINVSNMLQLQTLDISTNTISTIDLTAQMALTNFNCATNTISALNVNQLINLTDFDCSTNLLSAIDVSTLVNLQRFSCYHNQLAALDVISLVNLKTLNCAQNNLTSLDVAPLLLLEDFYCYSNQLTSIDLTEQTKLKHASCADNLFTALDFSHMDATNQNQTYPFARFSGNPNLVSVNLKNTIYISNFPEIGNFSAGCPNLIYICADESNVVSILQRLQYDGNTNVQVNSYCTFTPGGAYNTVAGTQTFDANGNGCDTLDAHFPFMKVTINDGTTTGATFTNVEGNYSFFTQAGNYVVTPIFEYPYFTVDPPSTTVNFTAVNNATQTQNFCITPLGIHSDVEITLLPLGQPRPGYNSGYKLIYKNKGNQIMSGNVHFTFDDTILDLVGAYPTATSQSLNQLDWSYTALYPFESREISIYFNLNSPQETPPVNNGDIISFTASIDPVAGDETVADNNLSFSEIVVGSFDPNDKTCLEGNTITPEMVGGYLHYLIRFQNSGTAAAENIVVKDIIDTTKFDISSLQLTSTSHPQVTKITGNKVEFQFANINLPAEIDNEPGSHGYVAFKIKTKGNLVIGNSVANKADIYFDYNFPIETNIATSTVALLGVNAFENTSVTVAPNPTQSILHIRSKGNIRSVQLFDVQGRLLETTTADAEQLDFDLSQKTTGVYFVKITTEKGNKTEKIIKQ